MWKFGVLAAGLMVLAACETMSKEECAAADWHAIGYTDGAAGATMKKFSDRAESCAKKGFQANLSAYNPGRDQGLRTFCVAGRGWSEGLNGYNYQGICPPDLEGGFLEGYRDGSYAYRVKSALSSAQSALSSARAQLDKLERDIAEQEGNVRDTTKTKEARDDARKKVDDLRSQRQGLRDKIRNAEFDVDQRQHEVDRAHRDIGGRWGYW